MIRRSGQRRDGRRQARERRGRSAERIASLFLLINGFRIVERRFKVPVGEIDIVAVKGRRLAFVEVKARADIVACEASITPKLRSRVRRAADVWMASHRRYHDYDQGFDLIFICRRKWPIYLKDGL